MERDTPLESMGGLTQSMNSIASGILEEQLLSRAPKRDQSEDEVVNAICSRITDRLKDSVREEVRERHDEKRIRFYSDEREKLCQRLEFLMEKLRAVEDDECGAREGQQSAQQRLDALLQQETDHASRIKYLQNELSAIQSDRQECADHLQMCTDTSRALAAQASDLRATIEPMQHQVEKCTMILADLG